MPEFRYHEKAAEFEDELRTALSESEKAAEAPKDHPSSGALQRMKRTALDDVKDVIARRQKDPQAAALLGDVLPQPTVKKSELDLDGFVRS